MKQPTQDEVLAVILNAQAVILEAINRMAQGQFNQKDADMVHSSSVILNDVSGKILSNGIERVMVDRCMPN